jgi:hypothetical protein
MNEQETTMTDKKQYREEMLSKIAEIIEATGQNDDSYHDKEKALDIMVVLEGLLGYTLFTICQDADEIRDAAEESYISIKRRALQLFRDGIDEEPQE